MNNNYFVYILASLSKVLYIGLTRDLAKRTYIHKHGLIEGFSKKYKCKKLVYYEHFEDVNNAISREKQIKKWRREKKVFLIEKINPTWKDLSSEISI